MKTAECVIIGAGVTGASVAYHLAARGCRDILVLDRESAPGQGSTARASGGFRAQFATDVEVRLSLLAREKLRRFQDEIGADPGYRPCGYLFMASSPAILDALLAAQRVQHAAGLSEARAVSVAEIRELNPAVNTDGLAGGTFCASDGFLRPHQIAGGYLAAAKRLGARVQPGTRVLGFDATPGGTVAAVRTSRGSTSARWVINAAGAWAGTLPFQGQSLPVRPLRRQVAITEPFSELPEDMPMTAFIDDGLHLRVRDGRVLLLWPDQPQDADPFDHAVRDDWVRETVRRARERVPSLQNAKIDREGCWGGLYEMTPDEHALLGLVPGAENLYVAAGSSGHGVMHAPALGHLLAEIILDGSATTLDVAALRPGRFAEGTVSAAAPLL